MDRRPQFQAVLEALQPGLKVYFQPPEDMKMDYPCIVYQLDPGSTEFANNKPYNYEQQYQVSLISWLPEPVLFKKLAALPKSIHARSYVADKLNHSVFSIYF
jgi:hypothetical protein